MILSEPLVRNGSTAVRSLVSTRAAPLLCRRRRRQFVPPRHAASTTDGGGGDGREHDQDTLRATLRDLPGTLASSLADELLVFGALSTSVDEFRPPGGGEQPLYGSRGRDNGSGPRSPDPSSSAVFWDRCTLTAIFDPSSDVRRILLEASAAAGVDPSELPEPALSTARASEWLDALRGAFSPTRVERGAAAGRSLLILPEGCSLPTLSDGGGGDGEGGGEREGGVAPVVVRLTPGLAFGSGDHPTTRMCLRWLATEEVSRALAAGGDGREGGFGTLLDYGTGSGVLAAAAIALGCRSAVGTDVDPLAVVAAEENAALNVPPPPPGALPRATFRAVLLPADPGSIDPVGPPASFHAVVANILRGPLLELAPSLARYARTGAPVAVSGILASQAEEVTAAFSDVGVELSEFGRELAGGGGGDGEERWWVCLSGCKKR